MTDLVFVEEPPSDYFVFRKASHGDGVLDSMYIAGGTTKRNGVPVSAYVVLTRLNPYQVGKRPLAATRSDDTGRWSFSNLNRAFSYRVEVFDDTGVAHPAALDRLRPWLPGAPPPLPEDQGGAGSEPWTPSLVDTTFWYDASDEDTLVYDSGTGVLSSWADKSGGGFTLVPWNDPSNTGDALVVAGALGQAVEFGDGGNPSILRSLAAQELGFGKPAHMVFAVIEDAVPMNSGDSHVVLSVEGQLVASTGKQIQLLAYRDGANGGADSNRLEYDVFTGTTFSETSISALDAIAVPRSGMLWCGEKDLYLQRQFVNGSQVGSTAAPTGTNAAYQRMVLGGCIEPPDTGTHELAFTGKVYEFVLVNYLDSTVRQKMEGYLAHKWGLTPLLPSSHPHKFAPPTRA